MLSVLSGGVRDASWHKYLQQKDSQQGAGMTRNAKETEAPAARTVPARDTSSHTCRVFYDRLYAALQQPSSVNDLLTETTHAQTLDEPFRRKLQHQSRKIRRLQSSP